MEKPTLKTMLIIADYWDCGIENHTHKSEVVAAACIRKQQRPKKVIRWTDEERQKLFDQYKSGMRLVDLAKSYKLSRSRIQQVIKRAERIELRKTVDDFTWKI